MAEYIERSTAVKAVLRERKPTNSVAQNRMLSITQRYGKPGTLTCHNKHAPSNRRNVGSADFCSYGEPKEG
jgi:hypothetical protein